MKKKIQSGLVPTAKVKDYLVQLSNLIPNNDNVLVRRADGNISVRVARGQYLTISIGKGGRL